MEERQVRPNPIEVGEGDRIKTMSQRGNRGKRMMKPGKGDKLCRNHITSRKMQSLQEEEPVDGDCMILIIHRRMDGAALFLG